MDLKGQQVSTLAEFIEKSGAVGVMRHKGASYHTCPQHVVSPGWPVPPGKPHSTEVNVLAWPHSADRRNDLFHRATCLFEIT